MINVIATHLKEATVEHASIINVKMIIQLVIILSTNITQVTNMHDMYHDVVSIT